MTKILFILALSLATSAEAGTLGNAAHNMSNLLSTVANLATTVAYIAGFGYAVSALLKFKRHHQSPSHMPIGTPITECFMAATLILLPYIATLQYTHDKDKPSNTQVAETTMQGLVQLPAPDPDFRHSDQEHFNEALGIQTQPKPPPPPPDPRLQDIRNQYKFD